MDIGKEVRVIEVTEESLRPTPERPPRPTRPVAGDGAERKAPAAAETRDGPDGRR